MTNNTPAFCGPFTRDFIQYIAEETINRQLTNQELGDMMDYLVTDMDDEDLMGDIEFWFKTYIRHFLTQ